MTDKLTAAGIEVPLELATYWDRKRDRASLGMQLCWADAAISALEDRLVETTNELRLSNRMCSELTDKHTEALMRAETAEAQVEELEEAKGMLDGQALHTVGLWPLARVDGRARVS